MRLGLYAPRRSSFWLIGPLAKAALKRGHDVVFLEDGSSLKPGDQWSAESARVAFGCWQVGWLHEFVGDWIAGAPPHQNWEPTDYQHVDSHGINLCSIDPWLDSLARPFPDSYDLTHRTIRHGLVPTDGLEDVPDRPKTDLLWFVPKTSVEGRMNQLQHRLVMIALGYALRRAARVRGRRFVIKTRSKIRLWGPLRHLADEIVEDTALYPHDSLRALASASLAVCHQSAACFEAAAAGVRTISIPVWQPYLHRYGHWPLMSATHGSPFGWPGVVDVRPWWKPVDNSPIDMDQRAAYIDTWFGGRVMGTSEWLLDEMERRT